MNSTNATGALFLLMLAPAAQAGPDIDPLFAGDEIIEAELEAPLGFLTRKRPDEDESPAKFRYTAGDGTAMEFDVAVRTRGRLRRGKETCTFPPLRLNFKKSQVKDTLFHKQDKLKLVTHCRNKSQRYVQSLIAEHVVYQILNLLTDSSYQTRLLRISYKSTDKGRDSQDYAIVIEHKDRLAKRLNATPVRTERVKAATIRPDDLNLASVFHYLIGNTDFSAIASAPEEDCCHNQVLFVNEEGLDYTVPYDFDQSGLVDAPHASPNERFRLKSVRDRLYRGRCANNALLPATLDHFREHRAGIEALIDEQALLNKRSKARMLKYVEKFYDTIDDPARLKKRIIDRCIN